MPELPEVETVRRDVSHRYAGHALLDIAVTGRRTVRRHPAAALSTLAGQRLVGVGRHGKYLLLEWEDGRVLVVHLRMSGQLLAAAAGDPRALHTHAVLAFSEADELRFVDPRTFGELFLAVAGPGTAQAPAPARPGPPALAELGHLGPDALAVDAAHLQAALARRRAPLKAVLVDQRALAGLGNIYADEVCYAAGLRPDRAAGSLHAATEVGRLAESVPAVLEAAIAGRGPRCGTSSTGTFTGSRAVTSSTTRCTAGRGWPAGLRASRPAGEDGGSQRFCLPACASAEPGR